MENFKQELPESYPQLVALEKIPESLNQVKLTHAQREMLSHGYPVYLENMRVENDGKTSIKDGTVQLKMQNGVASLAYTFKKPELEIDHEILGKKLTAQEEEQLKKGKMIGPFKIEGQEYFAQIDQQLNRVVVKTSRQVSDIKEIGGVKLNDQERLQLVNSEPITGKFFQSKDNSGNTVYFAATVALTPDKTGIEFSDIKPLTKEQYLEFTSAKTNEKKLDLPKVNSNAQGLRM